MRRLVGVIVLYGVLGLDFVMAVWLIILGIRDRRRGHRLRIPQDVVEQIRTAKYAVREAEDRWHQNQPWGRSVRGGRPERRRNRDYPWLG